MGVTVNSYGFVGSCVYIRYMGGKPYYDGFLSPSLKPIVDRLLTRRRPLRLDYHVIEFSSLIVKVR